MFVKSNKAIIIGLLVLILLIMIPIGFAADNSTAALSNQNANATQMVSIPLEENTLTASNDYYFDASAENDGDGSMANPYKYLTADRIKANSNLHLANGEYQLDASKTIEEVKIFGSDVDRTIIKYDGVAFKVNNQFAVSNVTLKGLSITNYAKFNATNVIFEDGYGSKSDYYGNNFGGAIFTDVDATSDNPYVNVDNCTFKDNYAVYGGAIYIGKGSLSVSDCLFFNNLAYNYGGAIACEYSGNVVVSKSKFYNSRSLADAGGSIYIRQSSKFAADYTEIVNSSATFGGAIATLNTSVSLDHVSIADSSTKYDGGAIYHMYGNFSASFSSFNNNSARNGGAIFIDNSTSANFMRNIFTNNRAADTGGAIYSLLNNLNSDFRRVNTFRSNVAAYENNYFETSTLNLTIGNGNYTMYKIDVNPVDSIPARYSLIDEGYVTSVKDQQTSGNCWAFTSITVLESCILKATGEKLDLSEENMKNIIALYSDYGWKLDTNEGGYDYMHWGYLSGWLGPVDEMDDLFDDKSTLSPLMHSIMHVQNIKFLKRNSYTDNDEIKRAILNYGAVGTGIYQDNRYLNYNNAYYCWYVTSQNHAVTIVGWDDNYSKYNFYGTPEGNGAWIVKNSWGSDWGDNGYFYVSYYDRNFARPEVEDTAYTYILNDTVRFDKNYQYDIAGITDYFLNSSSKVWYKNKFTSSCDEYLAAVSTYFQKASNWTATILVNNEIKDVISGMSTAGYYTFNLNKFIPLNAGDVFEVIFNITTSGEAGVPISEIVLLNKLVYSPETSYISYDGVNWADLYNLTWEYSTHTYNSAAASIKAFTYSNPIVTLTNLTIDFKRDGLSNITALVMDEFGNPVKYGNVTFSINGENQTVNVENGRASLLYNLNKKVNSISAAFDGVGYNSSSNATLFTLPKIEIAWALNITQVYNNVNLTVIASKMLNESIIMNINGENVPFALINGTNTLTLRDLANDMYSVHVSLSGDSDYSADILSGEFLVDVHHTRITSDNLTANDESQFAYNITLLDENGNPIAGKEIIFTINNVTYTNTTDDNGVAVALIKLDKGVYDVDASFKGDSNYFPSDASNTINVRGKIWINLEINTYNNNAFINIYATNRINETFTIRVNENPYYKTSKDGVAVLKLYNLPNDVYNVSVSLDENEYEFNKVESQFTINMVDNVEIESCVEMSGNDVVINILIGNATGYVNVIVDADSSFVDLVDGRANRTVENIAPGNHSLVIIYNENNFKSEVFEVPKKESSIELSFNDTAKIGEKTEIIVNVTSKATGLVSVDVNGTQYMVNLSKTDTLDLILNEAGTYSIVATYLGDDIFESSTSKEYGLVVKDKETADVSVSVSEIIKVGEDVEFGISGNFADDLKVYIDGELQKITNNRINYKASKAGLHTIEIISPENSDYYALNKTVPFNVVKNNATISINVDKTVFAGQTITVNASTDSDGSLTVRVNGQLIDSSYTVPSNGTFVVTVESDETDMYYRAFNSTAFSAVRQSSMVTVNVTAGKAGEKSVISVNVTDKATGIVIVSINGTDYSIDLSKTNILDVVLPKSGKYVVVANYMGDDIYSESQSSPETIVVNDKSSANINVDVPDDIKVGDEILISITSNSNAKLVVTINGEVQTVVYGKGVLGMSLNDVLKAISGKVKYTPLKEGIYNITVSAGETEDYKGETVTRIFEATKKDIQINIAPVVDAKVGDTVTISVDADTDGALTVMVNGELVAGEYEITKAGSYIITAESAATDTYNAGFATYTFVVEEEPVEPQTNITVVIDGKEYTADIINGTPIVNTNPDNNITVVVDGVSYPVVIVNGSAVVETNRSESDINAVIVVDGVSYPVVIVNGTASVETNRPDVVNVTVVVDGVSYPAKLVNGTVSVDTNKTEPVIKKASEFSEITISDTQSVSIVLKDEDGNVIANAPIAYAINGVSKTTATDWNGGFVIQGENGALISVSYAGSDAVTGTNVTLKLNSPIAPEVVKVASRFDIANRAITLNGYAVDGPAGEQGIYYATTLLDEKGKPISNAYIEFAVNNKIYNRTTYENGSFAPYKLNMIRAGRYTMAFNYAGDEKYTNAFACVCVDLDKKPITIKASAKSYKASTKTKKYTVTLSTINGLDGKMYLSPKTVKLTVNGKTYTGKTNNDGQVTFKINNLSKKGKYTAKISYEGDKTYESANKSVKLTVK